MGMRQRRHDPVLQGGAPVPATKTSHGAGVARTLRSRWWPRFLLAGVVLAVVGVTLLSGVAQAAVALLGVLVFVIALLQGLGASNRAPTDFQQSRDRMTVLRSSPFGSRREPPVPPGSGGPD